MSQNEVTFASDTEDNHPNYVSGWHGSGNHLEGNPSIPIGVEGDTGII